MGYAHSFKQFKEPTLEQWNELTTAFKKVVENLPAASETAGCYYPGWPINLQYEYDDPSPLQIDGEEIRFNGAWDYGHETFSVPRVPLDDDCSSMYCKTNRKPYDFAVCAALILVEKFAPDCYEVSSDGHTGDWMPALKHLQVLLELPDLALPRAIRSPEPGEINEAEKESRVVKNVPVWF